MKLFKLLLIVISIALIATLTACDSRVASQLLAPPPTERTIHVDGSGSVSGDPDIAILYIGVSVQKYTVAEAREVAAKAMSDLIETLKANTIDEEDIITQNFSIYPQYDWTDEGRILIGYSVNNSVSATVRELDTLSDVIDDAAEAGGDYVIVNSIQFSIDDPKPLQSQARSLAVKDAAAKAQTIAEAAGVTLGKPITITENTYFVNPPVPYDLVESAADDGASRTSTPIIPGELTITVNVSLIYEFE